MSNISTTTTIDSWSRSRERKRQSWKETETPRNITPRKVSGRKIAPRKVSGWNTMGQAEIDNMKDCWINRRGGRPSSQWSLWYNSPNRRGEHPLAQAGEYPPLQSSHYLRQQTGPTSVGPYDHPTLILTSLTLFLPLFHILSLLNSVSLFSPYTMYCPSCNNVDTKVIDSRIIEDGQAIKRRRICEYCSHRFNTYERKEYSDLLVIKKDTSKELYNRAKLKRSILLASAKRSISKDTIDQMITSLETERSMIWNEITSQRIGDDVLLALKKIDSVAYIRFASVYKHFDSLEDFQNIISA